MAQRTDRLDDETRSLYTDIYRYHERFQTMGNSDNDYILAFDEADYIWQKHGKTEFAYAMIFAVYEKLVEDRKDWPTEHCEQIAFV